MAYARIIWTSALLSVCFAGVAGCFRDADNAGEAASLQVQPKPVPTWYGLPMKPGLPPKLGTLSMGMPVTQLPEDWSSLSQPSGLALSAQIQASIALSSQRTVRYLTLKSTLSPEALLAQWPNSTSVRVDQRDTRHVWLLERERLQIHMKPEEKGFVLSYLPFTPLSHLIGPPSGTGMTFSSYVGKPLTALNTIIERTSNSQTGSGRLGWAHPLAFETLSLKLKIDLAEGTDRVRSLTVFLRDGFDNELRQRIEAYALKHWQKDSLQSTRFFKNGVVMRMEQTPQLGLRKRTHKMLTLRFEGLVTPPDKPVTPAQSAD